MSSSIVADHINKEDEMADVIVGMIDLLQAKR